MSGFKYYRIVYVKGDVYMITNVDLPESYLNLLSSARKYYDGAIENNPVKVTHYLADFFQKAESSNPSVARMALQQALCDTNIENAAKVAVGELSEEEIKRINNITAQTTKMLYMDKRLAELEKKVKHLEVSGKKIYPKTASKRLALAYSILDTDAVGLSNIKSESRIQKKLMLFIKKYMLR